MSNLQDARVRVISGFLAESFTFCKGLYFTQCFWGSIFGERHIPISTYQQYKQIFWRMIPQMLANTREDLRWRIFKV